MILASLAALLLAPAWAEEPDDAATPTVGTGLPKLGGVPAPTPASDPVPTITPARHEFEWQAYAGAEQLSMTPKQVHEIRQGLELVYLRQYKEARAHFADREEADLEAWQGMGAVADVVVWQSLMLENFDFRYEKQWETSSKRARADLAKAIARPGNEAWEHVLMASVAGIESIHGFRRTRYIGALQLAFEAMDHIEKARAAAPNFADLGLADGMYNYWRSAMTLSVKGLPSFGDERVKGIEQMQRVETHGVLTAPLATMGLVYTWLEEREYKRALAGAQKNQASYPDNIINTMLLGQTHVYMRHYPKAMAAFDDVLRVSPNNIRVHYWRGLVLQRTDKLAEAEAEFRLYLASEGLEPYQKSAAWLRLGQIAEKRGQLDEALTHYKTAVKLDGNEAAKKSIEKVKAKQAAAPAP